MKLIAIFPLAAALVAASAETGRLPACSGTSSLPCQCPSGTDYWESVTTEIIGACAHDVEELVNDFYDCGWLGAVPFKTQGPDNTVGSIRTSHFTTLAGVYDVSEELTEFKVEKDGSFIQRFEQLKSTVPLPYHSGNGSFGGYWVTLEAKAIFEAETVVVWSVYACETGHASNFAHFHEGALQNATSILKAAGNLDGITAGPFSAQNFTT